MDKDIAAVDDKGLVERLRNCATNLHDAPWAKPTVTEAASRLTVLRVALDEIANARWPSVDGDDPVKRIQALARRALSGEK